VDRRDFLALWLQALFLALFPWLRSAEGLKALAPAIDAMLPPVIDYSMFAAILKQRYDQPKIRAFYGRNPFLASITHG
jgi:hypothetical protein